MSNVKGAVEVAQAHFPSRTERSHPSIARSRAPARPMGSSTRIKPADHDEFALVERLKRGDTQAFDAIFNLYSPKLFKVAQKILGEAADTEEVIQDVFLTVFHKAKTFRGNARLSTWLYRLTVNAALGQLRRRKRNREVSYEDYLPQFQKDGHHLVTPVVDWSTDLHERYAEQELRARLKQALDQLRPVDKAVVILSDMEGFSDREVAETLKLSVPAVKTRLHRARLFLRGRLAADLGGLRK